MKGLYNLLLPPATKKASCLQAMSISSKPTSSIKRAWVENMIFCSIIQVSLEVLGHRPILVASCRYWGTSSTGQDQILDNSREHLLNNHLGVKAPGTHMVTIHQHATRFQRQQNGWEDVWVLWPRNTQTQKCITLTRSDENWPQWLGLLLLVSSQDMQTQTGHYDIIGASRQGRGTTDCINLGNSSRLSKIYTLLPQHWFFHQEPSHAFEAVSDIG